MGELNKMNNLTPLQELEFDKLDPWQQCDYFHVIDLGGSHDLAQTLATDLNALGIFLDKNC